MNLEHELRGGALILKPVGRLDSANSPELERILTEHLEQGTARVVFDFSELAYTSSAGLRVVLVAGKKLRPIKGRLILAGMREAVREIFEISGFLALFEFAPDVGTALKSM